MIISRPHNISTHNISPGTSVVISRDGGVLARFSGEGHAWKAYRWMKLKGEAAAGMVSG